MEIQNAYMQDEASLQTAKKDLAMLAIIGGGNDYVPALWPSLNWLWSAYCRLRQQPAWADRYILATGVGTGPHPHCLQQFQGP